MSKNWLTLKQASKQLNVHPTTLRRWADEGKLPFMRTPGGHRRFAVTDIASFTQNHTKMPSTQSVEAEWAEKAITQTRQGIVKQRNQQWLTHLDQELRLKHRALGQRLMGLTLQFVSSQDDNHNLLGEAHEVGLAYGHIALAAQLPLTDALRAAMFFRDTLVEVALQLPDTAQVTSSANVRLMQRINQLLNVVHIAIAESYEK